MANEEYEKQLKRGQLSILDKLAWGEEDIGPSISTYLDTVYSNRQSRRWARATNWAENMLFGLGHHYVSQTLTNRLNRDSNNNLTVSDDVIKSIPKPVNDLLGRFIETNVALLTENRPVPRVTAISDNIRDTKAAELSELTINYLWEELGLPEKHRELARHIMYTGIGFLETCYDPLMPRYMPVPDMREESSTPLSSGVMVPVPRQVQVIDEKTGELKYKEEIQYGDITANVVSGFEMHFPMDHYWNSDEMGWILREKYLPLEVVKDKYSNTKLKSFVTKKNGYFVDDIDKLSNSNLHTMPLWWWERLTDIVEGPSPTLFAATPEIWEGYTVMRIFDRKPNATWPQGRTIITVGDKLIYDSPKNVGARAFSTRWPKRWHPYTRYHWESVPGSIYGRSMVGKLLPCIKRINSIDTVLIMWRRTVPIATWLAPKGSQPVEDFFKGGEAGNIWEYDPRRTNNQAPTPVYPPPFPETALRERDMMLAQMEAISGTEQILKGERPVGATSATMLEALRKQALASRSATLQSWDESLQEVGTSLLQETIKHIKDDPVYKQRLSILAREKTSKFQIDEFSGENLSDNVQVRIDTASEAMISREAKQQRALELIQYGPNLAAIEPGLRARLVSDLGWPDAMVPGGPDITRGRNLVHWLKTKKFNLCVPLPEDDPYVIHEILVNETKEASFIDLENDVQLAFFKLIELYKDSIEQIENSRMQLQQQMMGGQSAPPKK